MDFSVFFKDPEKSVRSLIRKLTHSGELELDKQLLSEIKSICKPAPDKLMLTVFKECMKHLHKEHSQVRVSTLKLIDYLFQKSHIIREKLLDKFDLFLELTLAITQRPKIKLKLPPPKRHAALLQELTAKAIHAWHSDFGAGYEKIRYVYRFLKEHRLVDFSAFRVQTQEDLIKQRQLEEKQEKILKRSIENRLLEYKRVKPQIELLVAQIESLIELITSGETEFPSIQAGPNDTQGAADSFDSEKQHHGIANLSQNIQVEFEPFLIIRRNPDNKNLLANLRELKKQLVQVEMLKLVEIEKTLSKRSEELVSTLRDLIHLKSRATNTVMKLSELRLVEDEQDRNVSTLDNADSSSEDDFEDIAPKEDLETYIPKSMRADYGLEAINPKELDKSTTITLTDECFEPTPCSSKTDTTAFGLACNVRLANGRLCPRRDKVKCPFHGKIIARDHAGVPEDEEERLKEEKAQSRNKVHDWQDPELLRDIRMATGVDLTMPSRKSSRGTKEKKLCDTKSCDTTPKQRLFKRLNKLNRSL